MAVGTNIAWKNRSDLSQFLIHLTKDGAFERYTPVAGPPIAGFQKSYVPVKAKESLVGILNSLKIEARAPFGYYKLRINLGVVPISVRI